MNDKAILGAGTGIGGLIGGGIAPGIAALKAEYTLPEILDQVNKYTQGHYTVGDIASHARDVVKEPYRLLRKSVQDHGLVEGLVHQPEIASQIAGGATAGGALGLDLAQRRVDANNTVMKRLGRLIGRHPIAAGAAGLGALGLGAYGLMNHDSGSITDGIRSRHKESSLQEGLMAYTFAQAVNEGISKVAFDSEDQVADALIPTFGGPLGSALTAPGGRWINGPLREMIRGTFEGGIGGMAGTAGGGLLGALLGASLRRPELGAVGMALGGGLGSTAGAMHGAYASRRNQRKETGDYSTLGHRRDKDKQKKPKRDDD